MKDPVAFQQEAPNAEEEFTVITRNTWPARARGEGARDERGLTCSSIEHLKELMLAIESTIPPALMQAVWFRCLRAKWVAGVHAATDGPTMAKLLARFEINMKPHLLIRAWRQCTEATKKTLKTATGIVEYTIKRKKTRRTSKPTKKRAIEKQTEQLQEEEQEEEDDVNFVPMIDPKAKTLDESNILTGPRNRRQVRPTASDAEVDTGANDAVSASRLSVRAPPTARRKQLYPESWQTGRPFKGWRWDSREHTDQVREPFVKVARHRLRQLARQAGAREVTGFIYNLREIDAPLTQKQEELPPVITLQGIWRMQLQRARTVAAVEVQLACLSSALSWKCLADVDLGDSTAKRPARRRARASKASSIPVHEDTASWVELAVRGTLDAAIAAIELEKYASECAVLGANWVPDSKERPARQKVEGLLVTYDLARKKRFEAHTKRKGSDQQEAARRQQYPVDDEDNMDTDAVDDYEGDEVERDHARKKVAKRKVPKKKSRPIPSKKKSRLVAAKFGADDGTEIETAAGLGEGEKAPEVQTGGEESRPSTFDGTGAAASGVTDTSARPAGSATHKRKAGAADSSNGPAKQAKHPRRDEDPGVPEHLIERRVSGRSRKSAASFDPAAEARKPQWSK
jgi:hypothetical protein